MADILIFSFLSSKNLKEYFTLNEASEANLNADKRILKCQPFLHKVYCCPIYSLSPNLEQVLFSLKKK